MEQTTQVLIGALGGVAGGVVTMVCKYVVDRLMERQKVELSLAAKRREKYYEKQSVVLAGAYERLARCVPPTFGSYPTREMLDESLVDRINESAKAAHKASVEFDLYYRDNVIYIPKGLARRMQHVYAKLANMAIGGCVFPINVSHTFSRETLAGYQEYETEMKELLDRLQEEFRDYMVNGVVKPSNPDDPDELFGS
jgi:hypothetical protein